MDSLGEALSLEQFMAGCEAVGGGGAHPHALPHLGVTVPLPRTLEITPVKDAVPPAPSSVPSDATTMSVLTPVKAERLQQSQQQQQQQGNNHPDHHHHRVYAPGTHHTPHSGNSVSQNRRYVHLYISMTRKFI